MSKCPHPPHPDTHYRRARGGFLSGCKACRAKWWRERYDRIPGSVKRLAWAKYRAQRREKAA